MLSPGLTTSLSLLPRGNSQAFMFEDLQTLLAVTLPLYSPAVLGCVSKAVQAASGSSKAPITESQYQPRRS